MNIQGEHPDSLNKDSTLNESLLSKSIGRHHSRQNEQFVSNFGRKFAQQRRDAPGSGAESKASSSLPKTAQTAMSGCVEPGVALQQSEMAPLTCETRHLSKAIEPYQRPRTEGTFAHAKPSEDQRQVTSSQSYSQKAIFQSQPFSQATEEQKKEDTLKNEIGKISLADLQKKIDEDTSDPRKITVESFNVQDEGIELNQTTSRQIINEYAHEPQVEDTNPVEQSDYVNQYHEQLKASLMASRQSSMLQNYSRESETLRILEPKSQIEETFNPKAKQPPARGKSIESEKTQDCETVRDSCRAPMPNRPQNSTSMTTAQASIKGFILQDRISKRRDSGSHLLPSCDPTQDEPNQILQKFKFLGTSGESRDPAASQPILKETSSRACLNVEVPNTSQPPNEKDRIFVKFKPPLAHAATGRGQQSAEEQRRLVNTRASDFASGKTHQRVQSLQGIEGPKSKMAESVGFKTVDPLPRKLEPPRPRSRASQHSSVESEKANFDSTMGVPPFSVNVAADGTAAFDAKAWAGGTIEKEQFCSSCQFLAYHLSERIKFQQEWIKDLQQKNMELTNQQVLNIQQIDNLKAIVNQVKLDAGFNKSREHLRSVSLVEVEFQKLKANYQKVQDDLKKEQGHNRKLKQKVQVLTQTIDTAIGPRGLQHSQPFLGGGISKSTVNSRMKKAGSMGQVSDQVKLIQQEVEIEQLKTGIQDAQLKLKQFEKRYKADLKQAEQQKAYELKEHDLHFEEKIEHCQKFIKELQHDKISLQNDKEKLQAILAEQTRNLKMKDGQYSEAMDRLNRLQPGQDGSELGLKLKLQEKKRECERKNVEIENLRAKIDAIGPLNHGYGKRYSLDGEADLSMTCGFYQDEIRALKAELEMAKTRPIEPLPADNSKEVMCLRLACESMLTKLFYYNESVNQVEYLDEKYSNLHKFGAQAQPLKDIKKKVKRTTEPKEALEAMTTGLKLMEKVHYYIFQSIFQFILENESRALAGMNSQGRADSSDFLEQGRRSIEQGYKRSDMGRHSRKESRHSGFSSQAQSIIIKNIKQLAKHIELDA